MGNEIREVLWELNPQYIDQPHNIEAKVIAGLSRSKDTDKATGVYFRWRLRIKQGDNTFLNAVIEQGFKLTHIAAPTVREHLEVLRWKSSLDLKAFLINRIDLYDLQYDLGEPQFENQTNLHTLLSEYLKERGIG